MRDDKRRSASGPRRERSAGPARGGERREEAPRGEAKFEHRREQKRTHRPPASRDHASRDQVFRDHASRDQVTRDQVSRDDIGHDQVRREKVRRDAVPAAGYDPLAETAKSNPASNSRPDARPDQRPDGRKDQRKDRRHENRAKRWSEKALSDDGPVRIFGIHSVEAALLNPARKVLRLLLTENAEKRLEAALAQNALAKNGATFEATHPRDLDRLLGEDTVHQGALLETEALAEPTFEELADRAMHGGPLVVLDQVTDPHNVGAILRSAAAFGASGLVMTRRNSPPLSGVLAKSASGALEHVPVALVPNLAQALGKLGDLAILRIGLDGSSEVLIEDQDLRSGIALVLGAEGKGLRRLTSELCDRLCRITTAGTLQSLNVSNAAAIALHAAAVQRRKA